MNTKTISGFIVLLSACGLSARGAEQGVHGGKVVSYFAGEQIAIKAPDSSAMKQFKLGEPLKIIDSAGRVGSPEAIKVGAMVTLLLEPDGKRVSQIVITQYAEAETGAKSTAAPSTTSAPATTAVPSATVSGTVDSFDAKGSVLKLRTNSTSNPVPYAVTAQTRFTGASGEEIAGEKITAGDAVVIYPKVVNGLLRAERVVVRTLKELNLNIRGVPAGADGVESGSGGIRGPGAGTASGAGALKDGAVRGASSTGF